MRTVLLPIHIIAGLTAIAVGFVALFALKGAKLHRKSGMIFVYSMVIMGLTGAVIALLKLDVGTALGGVLVFYLVITGLVTFRRDGLGVQWIDRGAALFGWMLGLTYVTFGFQALYSITGRKYGYPPPLYFVFGTITLLAAIGDARMLFWGIQGPRRLARHLWRMCFAMFIATGSFFLGQAKVFPKPLRIIPLLSIPVLIVIVAMLYWLWRVRVRRNVRGIVGYGSLKDSPHSNVRRSTLSPIRSLTLLFLAAITLGSSAVAQSIDHARQLFDGGKYAEAKGELVALQKADDRNAAAAYYLGRLATFDNDGDEAIRQFERAVQLEEGNALYHTWLGNAIGEAAGRASKFKQPFMARRVKKEWERAVQLDPNLIEARVDLVQFYTMAPGFMGGSIDKAREQAGEITKRNAVRGALARGMIAEHEKNAVAEEAAYQQAISAAPDSAAGYFALSHAYARDGKSAESFAAIDQYVKRRPDDRWALYHTGRAAGTTGQQLDRGEAALQQFLATPPSDAHATTMAGAHYWLGQIAEKRGAKDVAREHYRTALKINPKAEQPQRALDALK